MHPVEHLIYFTRGVSACLVAAHHPAIFLFYSMRDRRLATTASLGWVQEATSFAYLQGTARAHFSGGSQYH